MDAEARSWLAGDRVRRGRRTVAEAAAMVFGGELAAVGTIFCTVAGSRVEPLMRSGSQGTRSFGALACWCSFFATRGARAALAALRAGVSRSVSRDCWRTCAHRALAGALRCRRQRGRTRRALAARRRARS